jgi:hypothetical protein
MATRKSHNGSPSRRPQRRTVTGDFSIKDKQHIASKHAGQWVALKNGKAVAYSKDSAEVFRDLANRKVKGAVIHYLPPVSASPEEHPPES